MFKKLLVTMLAVVMTVCLAISLSACVNFTSYDGHKHTYGSFEVTAPTETETGLAKATCSDCDEWDIGHVLTVELPVLTDKAYKTSYKVEPTCENTGVMQYAYTYKGFTVTFDVVVDELGHYWEWVPEVPATEEAAGMKAHFVCSGCGKFFDADFNEVSAEDLAIEFVPTYQAEEDTYYLVGKMKGESHWIPYTDDLKLTANEGNNGAIMNVELNAGDEIKVYKNGTYYPCAATEGVNTVVADGDGAGNGYILNDGTYNIYINTQDVVYIANANAAPQPDELGVITQDQIPKVCLHLRVLRAVKSCSTLTTRKSGIRMAIR